MQEHSLMEAWSKQWTEVEFPEIKLSDDDARFELLQLRPRIDAAVKRLEVHRKTVRTTEAYLTKLTERKHQLESQLVTVKYVPSTRTPGRRSVKQSALAEIIQAAKAGKLMEYVTG